MKSFTLKGILAVSLFALISTTKLAAQTVTLSPSTTQNISVGGTVNFTATRSSNSSTWPGGDGNFTYTWSSSPAGATFTSNPNTVTGSSSSTVATFPSAGNFLITCHVTEGGSVLNATSPATTVNVTAPLPANLWATSTNGNRVSGFTVNAGVYSSGPNDIFDPFPSTTQTTAALGRSDFPNPTAGHFYWLPNTGTNGVVNVFAASSTGAGIVNIGSLDVNGVSNNSLGFVRLAMDDNGTGWILAGDGTTVYLAKFATVSGNELAPVTITVEDASVTLVGGGGAATFQNGDICLDGTGRILALANNAGTTEIYVGTPAGAGTT
ncbi:MAG: hypothetical protein ABL876_17180, partial [Chitinophagaceae bacterium]